MFQLPECSQVSYSIVEVLLRQMLNHQYTSSLCLGAMLVQVLKHVCVAWLLSVSCLAPGSVSTDEALNQRLPERHRQGRTSKDSRDDGTTDLTDPAGGHHDVCVTDHR